MTDFGQLSFLTRIFEAGDQLINECTYKMLWHAVKLCSLRMLLIRVGGIRFFNQLQIREHRRGTAGNLIAGLFLQLRKGGYAPTRSRKTAIVCGNDQPQRLNRLVLNFDRRPRSPVINLHSLHSETDESWLT